MNTVTKAAVLGFVAATAIPALADSVEALKPGEAIAIMPDGNMARAMISDATKLEMLPGTRNSHRSTIERPWR